MSIREHTSHTHTHTHTGIPHKLQVHWRYTSAYVSIRQHTSAYVSISVYIDIYRHTSAYRTNCRSTGGIRQHTSAYRYISVYIGIYRHTAQIAGPVAAAVAKVHVTVDVRPTPATSRWSCFFLFNFIKKIVFLLSIYKPLTVDRRHIQRMYIYIHIY